MHGKETTACDSTHTINEKEHKLINNKIMIMFNEELYAELGKLFYYIASVDGKVQSAERKTLQELIHSVWEPLEDSVDEFGTDKSAMIDFSFDFEESANETIDGIQSFEEFYKFNKKEFTPVIIKKILKTGKAIASAYRGNNKDEKAVLEKVETLFQKQ